MKKYQKRVSSDSSDTHISGRIIRRLANQLGGKLGLDQNRILELLDSKEKDVLLPVSIFSNSKLSSLELIVKYLKEELGMHFNEIALLLKRDYKSIWGTYSAASRKQKEALTFLSSKYFIPIKIIAVSDQNLSTLESIVSYMKDELDLRYSEIGSELHRDQRNIWTVYNRAKKKIQARGRNAKA
jgi:hypothetical protein